MELVIAERTNVAEYKLIGLVTIVVLSAMTSSITFDQTEILKNYNEDISIQNTPDK